MKTLFISVLVTFAAIFGGNNFFGQCDCIGKNLSKDIRGSKYHTAIEEFRNSDAVFYGQIVEMKMIPRKPVRDGAADYEVEITFKVENAWRRDLNELVKVREYGDGCLIGFSIASRWLVYANLDEDQNLRTVYCTRTRRADKDPQRDFKEFEEKGERQKRILKLPPN